MNVLACVASGNGMHMAGTDASHTEATSSPERLLKLHEGETRKTPFRFKSFLGSKKNTIRMLLVEKTTHFH